MMTYCLNKKSPISHKESRLLQLLGKIPEHVYFAGNNKEDWIYFVGIELGLNFFVSFFVYRT